MDNLTLSLFLKVVDQASRPLHGVTRALEGVGRASAALQQLGTSMSLAGSVLDAASQRMQASIDSVIAPTNELEGALAALRVATGETGADSVVTFNRTRDAALAWQSQHTQSAAEFVAATTTMVSAVDDEASAIAGAQAALAASLAVGGDATTMAKTLGIVYAQVGDHSAAAADEMNRLASMLVATRQAFGEGVRVDEFFDPLKDALPAARSAGVAFEQIVTAVGALNRVGIEGGEAGAGFAALVDSMRAASEQLGFDLVRNKRGGLDLVQTIGAIRERFGTLEEMSPEVAVEFQAAFGGGYQAISLLLGQMEPLRDGLEHVRTATTAATEAQRAREATTTAHMAIVRNQFDALKTEIGTQLLPAIEGILPHVTRAIEAFKAWSEEHPKLVQLAASVFVATAAFAALLSPVLLTAGGLVMFAGQTMGAVSKLADFTKNAIEFGGKAVSAIWSGARQMARGMWVFGRATAQAIFGLGRLSMAILTVAARSAVSLAGAAARMAVSLVTTLVPALVSAATAAATFAASLLANPITWVVLAIVAAAALIYVAWEPISNFFTGLWADIKAGFESLNPFEPIRHMANEVFGWLANMSLEEAGMKLIDTLWSGIQSVASKPVEAMRGVVTRIRRLLPFSPAKDGPLRDLHRVRLMETVADAVRPEPLVSAVSAAASAAMLALVPMAPALAVPSFAPMPTSIPSSGGGGRAGAGPAPVMNVTIQVQGGGEDVVAQLERWLRQPETGRRLFAAVERVRARTVSTGLGE